MGPDRQRQLLVREAPVEDEHGLLGHEGSGALALARVRRAVREPRRAVNAVAPGPTGTELWLGPGGLADQNARARGISREEALEVAVANVPRGRLATEDEIAAVVVFLCSELASNVAGAAWSVDGGTVPVII